MTIRFFQTDRWRSCIDRFDFCAGLVIESGCEEFAEIGVWKGEFAAAMLSRCPALKRYVMIDPWQHLEGWNKPANVSEKRFGQIYAMAMEATEKWAAKREVMRMTTVDAMRALPDGSLDAVYVDSDHTLRGITLDLQSVFTKVRSGGLIIGDDLSPSIWQHPQDFEPSFVFPYAVYFAEAVGCPIHAGPFNQFVIEKAPESGFSFTDLTGDYPDTSVRAQILNPLGEWFTREACATRRQDRRYRRFRR